MHDDFFTDIAKTMGCERVVFLDFETYYDSDFSLTKMTTPEYVNDGRFEVIGLGIVENYLPTQWFTDAAIKGRLSQIDWDTTLAVAHNGYFDFTILAKRYGIHPKRMYCTMQGARPHMVPFSHSMGLAKLAKWMGLKDKGTEVVMARGKTRTDFTPREMTDYGRYCIHDVDLCRSIFAEQSKLVNADEMLMVHLTLHKGVVPQLELNQRLLSDSLVQIQKDKAALLASVGITDRKELMSNNRFAELLSNCGIEPPTKISLTTGRQTYAFAKTDPEMQMLGECGDRHVEALVAARIGHKSTIEETRIARLLNVSRANHGRVVWPMLYFGARTGRFSGYDRLNMQNLPKNSPIRRAIRAPEGHKLVVADLSQIEARVLAVVAEETELVEGFRNGVDIYKAYASQIYSKPEEEIDDNERFVGKTAILGLGYGCGSTKFRTMLGTKIHKSNLPSTEWCFNLVQDYRSRFSGISRYWTKGHRVIAEMSRNPESWEHVDDYIQILNRGLLLPTGRTLYYPGIESKQGEKGSEITYTNSRGHESYLYGGKLTENIVQALAQIVIRDIELNMFKLLKGTVVAAGQVHDELIYCVEEQHAEKFAKVLKRVMTTPPEWMPELPCDCTIAIGDNYAEAK